MIKVSVLYPNAAGVRFDVDYYCTKHMPMVRDKLGAALRGLAVDRGIDGGRKGTPGPYVAACHLFFDSVDAFHAAFDPNAKAILADVPNCTNATPVMQVSEVLINASRGETGDLHLHRA